MGFAMGLKIPESIRSEVMQKWLQGLSRNKIAAICGISQAATSGIIDDWKRSVGVTLAEQYGDLSTAMERQGISITQCAQGYRIFVQSNLCIDIDRAESFLGETISRCIGIGFSPQDIASHLEDLVSFAASNKNLGIEMDEAENDSDSSCRVKDSQSINGVSYKVPSILQIAKYMEKTKEEIKKTELKNKQLKEETEALEANKTTVIQEMSKLLKERDITAEKLDWHTQLKTELLIAGYSENDFELALKAMIWLKEEVYNILSIAAKFSDHERLKSSIRKLQVLESVLERKCRELDEKVRNTEVSLESKSQLRQNMVELEKMGFNLKQLRRLYNVIKEINEANGFSGPDGYAVTMFMDQVERYYNDLIGFEKQAREFKEELQNLNIYRLAQLNILSALPYVGKALTYLLGRGLGEDQILELANIVKMHPEIIQSSTKNDNGNNSNNYSTEGQQRTDDIKSVKSSSSASAPSSSRPYSASSSSLISSPPSQQAFPQTSTTTPTSLTSTSAPLPQSYLTTKLSADDADIGAKTNTQSIMHPTESCIKMKDNFSPSASDVLVVTPAQDESRFKDSQPVDTRNKDDILNRDPINPYLNQTPTFLDIEVTFPKSIFRNKPGQLFEGVAVRYPADTVSES
jgi:hypothetical protein